MLINFITALAWIIAVGLGGWCALLFTVYMFTPKSRLTLNSGGLLSVAASAAWLIAKYSSN